MLRYRPKVEYIPGKYLFIADLLSREYLDETGEDDPGLIEIVHEVTKQLPVSIEVKDEVAKATAQDKGLQAVAS